MHSFSYLCSLICPNEQLESKVPNKEKSNLLYKATSSSEMMCGQEVVKKTSFNIVNVTYCIASTICKTHSKKEKKKEKKKKDRKYDNNSIENTREKEEKTNKHKCDQSKQVSEQAEQIKLNKTEQIVKKKKAKHRNE
ncbi:hypothetical protein RFI_27363 [Reticulomyxa filosa]|uniref:Uncharacterized protein n=1 Tax=Reticulomyxa filosa TaxID=46433 RepID=X6M7X6_RETFI|nr:hypothetical protein RFI_27363 [Reticulomyxa filosa]|eukprot:ETO10014.1 hypothetical protein RFI_27363 [Reticulomyxa filosa]